MLLSTLELMHRFDTAKCVASAASMSDRMMAYCTANSKVEAREVEGGI